MSQQGQELGWSPTYVADEATLRNHMFKELYQSRRIVAVEALGKAPDPAEAALLRLIVAETTVKIQSLERLIAQEAGVRGPSWEPGIQTGMGNVKERLSGWGWGSPWGAKKTLDKMVLLKSVITLDACFV